MSQPLRTEIQSQPMVVDSFPPESSAQTPMWAGPFPRSAPEREASAASAASHARWHAVYQQVQTLHREGHNILQIAGMLHVDRKTVRKYISFAEFPKRAKHPSRTSILDPYLPHLLSRRQEGCTNGKQLWREIYEQGYGGGYGQVIRWLRQQREQSGATPASEQEEAVTPQCQCIL